MNDTERPEPAADAVDAVVDGVQRGSPRVVFEDDAAVEPEPGLSLDAVEAMLDDPNVVSALGRSFAQRRNGEADYESRPSYRSFCDGEGVSEVEAALAVMREVQAAVRQAKENGDG